MKKNNITYGKYDLDEDEFDPKYKKIRITTMLDADVLEALKVEASSLGVGYQTLLNEKLKQVVLGADSIFTSDKADQLYSEIEKLKKRVSKIEKKKAG